MDRPSFAISNPGCATILVHDSNQLKWVPQEPMANQPDHLPSPPPWLGPVAGSTAAPWLSKTWRRR